MLELKSKQKLSTEAHAMAVSLGLVRYRSQLYAPMDYETHEVGLAPVDRQVWQPLTRDDIRDLAAAQFSTLFGTEAELSGFHFMVTQNATPYNHEVSGLFVRTTAGLRVLNSRGALVAPDGRFLPNYLKPALNENKADKKAVFNIIAEWVGGEADAHSLLNHLATCLAPNWSAVKYVILLGEGRNGKGVLLKMLSGLFGVENISHVTRQHMAEQNPVVTELNGKLLNVIFDGQADYLKDSGTEKTLVAGEPVPIRKLYESSSTIVQTNALFIEGLNLEPKSKDKSSALQKRLVRFGFPNVYPLDPKFAKKMVSERRLGAFLSLLIDHFVTEDNVVQALALTAKSVDLQLEHTFTNSIALQFFQYVTLNDPLGQDSLLGVPVTDLANRFRAWRVKENDLGLWAEPDIKALFKPLLNMERKSVRVNGSVTKAWVTTSFRDEAIGYLNTLKGDEADETEQLEVVGE